MKRLWLGIVSVSLLALGCSTLQTGADYEPATDWAKYRTFAFHEGSGRPRNAFAVERFRRAVTAALESKGWKRVEEGGDATVYTHFHLDARTELRTTGYASAGWYGWRRGGIGVGTATTTVREIPVGTVVVDIVDSAEKKLVWRGWAKDEVTKRRTPEEAEEYARASTAKLFENFPPAK